MSVFHDSSYVTSSSPIARKRQQWRMRFGIWALLLLLVLGLSGLEQSIAAEEQIVTARLLSTTVLP